MASPAIARPKSSSVIAAKRDASEQDRTALPPILASLFAENESIVPNAEFPKRERGELGELDEILKAILE